jgi:hypothetical protein
MPFDRWYELVHRRVAERLPQVAQSASDAKTVIWKHAGRRIVAHHVGGDIVELAALADDVVPPDHLHAATASAPQRHAIDELSVPFAAEFIISRLLLNSDF